MADRQRSSTDPTQSSAIQTQTNGHGIASTNLDADQLDRWAELVASGEALFPTELCFSDHRPLADRISRLRRARLIRFVARAIAQDIHRATGQHESEEV